MKIPQIIPFTKDILELEPINQKLNYKYSNAVFDIANFNNKIFFSLYYKNKIISFDAHKGFNILPFEISNCHSVYIKDKILFASCFREKSISSFYLNDFSKKESFNFDNYYPISSIVKDNKIIFIDFINSKLISFNLNNKEKKYDLSNLLKDIISPHSIKINKNLICICTRKPSKLIILKDLKIINKKSFADNFDFMSAYPLNDKKIIMTCIDNGLFIYDIPSQEISLISDKINCPTSVIFNKDDLYLSSEKGNCLYLFENFFSL